MYVVKYTNPNCHKHEQQSRHPLESYAESEAALHNPLCPHHNPDDPCAVVTRVEGVNVNARGKVIVR